MKREITVGFDRNGRISIQANEGITISMNDQRTQPPRVNKTTKRKKNSHHNIWTQPQIDQLEKYYVDENRTVKQVARKMGRTFYSVRNAVSRFEIRKR